MKKAKNRQAKQQNAKKTTNPWVIVIVSAILKYYYSLFLFFIRMMMKSKQRADFCFCCAHNITKAGSKCCNCAHGTNTTEISVLTTLSVLILVLQIIFLLSGNTWNISNTVLLRVGSCKNDQYLNFKVNCTNIQKHTQVNLVLTLCTKLSQPLIITGSEEAHLRQTWIGSWRFFTVCVQICRANF